jgi:Ca-activated chloride channel family protein
MRKGLNGALLAGAIALSAGTMFPAISVAQDDDDEGDSIIVTGTRITTGGAKDIKHFRSIAANAEFLPPTHSLTVEGLLGEHDLILPRRETCEQMFCLVGHSAAANLPARPQDAYFVGLDFDSNIDGDSWKRAPLSLVAVVDRSGSMSGTPIAKVQESLRAVLAQLGEGDRMGIVIYGSDTVVHLAPTDVANNRSEILNAIGSIQINGSTYMEAGLKLGYQTAFEELARSNGKTRLMLFTDENPNVGNTSAEGFMGLAEAGSRRGVGLTTVGVGVHFDGALATRVSSVRGGNLFFVDAAASAKDLFDKEFRNMVSEVAHDVVIAMTPPQGYSITGVYGVPDGLMTETKEGTVKITVGSAFLSSNNGGIYATVGRSKERENRPLAPLSAGSPVLDVELAYVDALNGEAGAARLAVPQPEAAVPANLSKAMVLVDEYLTVDDAIDTYHSKGDRKAAFAMLDGLANRLESSGLDGLYAEKTLVGGLRDKMAYLAGYQGEIPAEMRPTLMVGEWKVTHYQGMTGIRRGDTVELTSNGEFVTRPDDNGDDTYQAYEVNERQLRLFPEEWGTPSTVFTYRLNGDHLNMRTRDGEAMISLVRK